MKLIVAQGNPGTHYHDTRHNVGFSMLNSYAESVGASWVEKSKFRAYIAEYNTANEKILLVKPTTYYNDTGAAVRALLDFYKVDPRDILVLHDDIALPLGTVRTRQQGSDAGNNGIKSLNLHLGQDYRRVRIGIWNELAERMEATAFVLAKFTSDDRNHLAKIQSIVHATIDSFTQGTFAVTSYKIEP